LYAAVVLTCAILQRVFKIGMRKVIVDLVESGCMDELRRITGGKAEDGKDIWRSFMLYGRLNKLDVRRRYIRV
jgi:hypothetical protein